MVTDLQVRRLFAMKNKVKYLYQLADKAGMSANPTSADRYQNPHFCVKNKESLHYIAFKIFSASVSFAGNTNPR